MGKKALVPITLDREDMNALLIGKTLRYDVGNFMIDINYQE